MAPNIAPTDRFPPFTEPPLRKANTIPIAAPLTVMSVMLMYLDFIFFPPYRQANYFTSNELSLYVVLLPVLYKAYRSEKVGASSRPIIIGQFFTEYLLQNFVGLGSHYHLIPYDEGRNPANTIFTDFLKVLVQFVGSIITFQVRLEFL